MKRIFSILQSIALFFLILTISIGVPIYVRPFYYAHIQPLELEKTGFSETEIRQAYDEVLDYLTLPDHDFGTGVFRHSAEGAAHFADCKILFDLNLTILLGSTAILLIIFIVRRRQKWSPLMLGRFRSEFYSGLGAILIPVCVGGLAALDFDRAFVIFHSIFFPGKNNWMFDSFTDEIILILPQVFFRNCGILIGATLLLCSTCVMIWSCIFGKERVK